MVDHLIRTWFYILIANSHIISYDYWGRYLSMTLLYSLFFSFLHWYQTLLIFPSAALFNISLLFSPQLLLHCFYFWQTFLRCFSLLCSTVEPLPFALPNFSLLYLFLCPSTLAASCSPFSVSLTLPQTLLHHHYHYHYHHQRHHVVSVFQWDCDNGAESFYHHRLMFRCH